jgi:hypothetical protein
VVSTDILLTGFGLVWCVESKSRIKQVPKCFKVDKYRFCILNRKLLVTFLLPSFIIILGTGRCIIEVDKLPMILILVHTFRELY